MPQRTVSVVIPFLDPPIDFFREAVASVRAQDTRPKELILVNDGSGEEATAFARGIAENADFPVRYVQHEGGMNLGSSASRNAGAAIASGEYLAFLDADDVWAPGKLGEQTAFLDRRPQIAMVFGQTRYWYSWQAGAAAHPDFVVSRGVKRETRFEPPDFVASFLRGRVIVPSASSSLIRRSAYFACGGFEARFRGMYEDQAFLVKLGLRYPVAGVPKCWDSYRQHPASMTASAGLLSTERGARRDFLEWTRGYCAARAISAPAVWEAVNKEIWLVRDGNAGTPAATVRRMKQWSLRAEEAMLPDAVRHRLWGMQGLLSGQSRKR